MRHWKWGRQKGWGLAERETDEGERENIGGRSERERKSQGYKWGSCAMHMIGHMQIISDPSSELEEFPLA